MAAALNAPVSVMETAGEGGPWGMALLAAYAVRREKGESLSDYLNNKVFAGSQAQTARPEADDVAGFAEYTRNFVATLDAQRAAVKGFN